MRKYILLTIALFGLLLSVSGQEYITEDKTHIIWQEGKTLSFDDYQGPYQEISGLDTTKCGANGFFGVGSVLDIQKNKRILRQGQLEHAYFVPMFSKYQSFLTRKDSTDLRNDQLMWEICEVACRWARRQLHTIYIQMCEDSGLEKITGTIAIHYQTVYNQAKELKADMCNAFFANVVMEQTESYESWREMIDEMLEDMKDYATPAEDAHRILTGKPTNKKLKQAESVWGDMRKKESAEEGIEQGEKEE